MLTSIMSRYVKCPICGHDKLGQGHGKLIVQDNIFDRSCRCGFRIVINDKEEILLHHYENRGNTYCGKCGSKVEGGYCNCMLGK